MPTPKGLKAFGFSCVFEPHPTQIPHSTLKILEATMKNDSAGGGAQSMTKFIPMSIAVCCSLSGSLLADLTFLIATEIPPKKGFPEMGSK